MSAKPKLDELKRTLYHGVFLPQIQHIMDQSLCCSHWITLTVCAHISLPCSIADHTTAEYNFPQVFNKTMLGCMGKRLLNLPQGTEHLVIMASSHPPSVHNNYVSKIAERMYNIHFSVIHHHLVSNPPISITTSRTNIPRISPCCIFYVPTKNIESKE